MNVYNDLTARTNAIHILYSQSQCKELMLQAVHTVLDNQSKLISFFFEYMRKVFQYTAYNTTKCNQRLDDEWRKNENASLISQF